MNTYDQQTLFPDVPDGWVGLPYTPSSATSKAAAVSMLPHAGTQRLRILQFIQSMGDYGATCDEIEMALGIIHQSASKRIQELGEAGWLYPSGTRQNRSKRQGTVMIAREVPDLERRFVPRQDRYKGAIQTAINAIDGGDPETARAILVAVLS